MADLPGVSDPDVVKIARLKHDAILRAKWRLEQRLATIDWEHAVLKPSREALEKRITVLGELPEFSIAEEETPSGGRPNRKRS